MFGVGPKLQMPYFIYQKEDANLEILPKNTLKVLLQAIFCHCHFFSVFHGIRSSVNGLNGDLKKVNKASFHSKMSFN